MLSFGGVRVHPNAFHAVLENVAAAGWQVIQDDNFLDVHLIGVRDQAVCEQVGRTMRELLESQGARVPRIRVSSTDQLKRGITGKAPLIAAVAR